MTDFTGTARPDVFLASGDEVADLLGPPLAYLRALEARVAALERRLSVVPLMTTAEAARYARVGVETILRAVRAGQLSVAGYVGRSPRISRDALNGLACREIVRSSTASSTAPPPSGAKGKRCR